MLLGEQDADQGCWCTGCCSEPNCQACRRATATKGAGSKCQACRRATKGAGSNCEAGEEPEKEQEANAKPAEEPQKEQEATAKPAEEPQKSHKKSHKIDTESHQKADGGLEKDEGDGGWFLCDDSASSVYVDV